MVRAQGMIPTRWIVTCVCLLLTVYSYQRLSAVWKPKTSERSAQKPSKPSEEIGAGKTVSAAPFSDPILGRSVEGLDPKIYDPYPKYNTAKWSKEWKGSHAPCMGPRGVPVNGEADDMLIAYSSVSEGSVSDPTFGSFEDTGLDSITCFGSDARYRPYGYTEEDNDRAEKSSASLEVMWEDVKWGDLQRECILKNGDRYEDVDPVNQSTIFRYAEYSDVENIDETLYFPEGFEDNESKGKGKGGPKIKKRSAVVFQMQESKEWTLDTTQYVRSVIMELSLHTGGEYEVFILIEVADDAQPIFNNRGVHQKILERSVPREFQGVSLLFNRKLLEHWYPRAQKEINVLRSPQSYAPLQLLSLARPDIEFFWQMDVDARYTGHHYDHLERVADWSKAQPREVLWEKASQVYMKGVHKSWNDFTAAIKNSAKKSTIRGPLRTRGITPVGPEPPMMLRGKDRWGIGEDADLITFGQVFDPVGSWFPAKREVDNYPDGVEGTPRRATPFSTITRTSKRLLRAMHHGQVTLGTNMSPLMFPASTALHHGLKVVAFPIPIFLDVTIAPEKLHKEFNSEWGRHTYDSPFKYTEIWRRMTFAISVWEDSTFADELYKKWLGYDEKHTKGLCLPGIMLHPIQGV